MKCWISALNAQGSRETIVPVQVGAGGAAQEKERQGETQEPSKLMVPQFQPPFEC